jgi:hypothetical protein
MKKQLMIYCNLCSMILPQDELIENRLNRHTVWHEKAHVQKRHTTQGTPIYSTSLDDLKLS